jgi:hypothetical protein
MRTTDVFDDHTDDDKTNNLKIDIYICCRPLGRWPWFLLTSLEQRCFKVESAGILVQILKLPLRTAVDFLAPHHE